MYRSERKGHLPTFTLQNTAHLSQQPQVRCSAVQLDWDISIPVVLKSSYADEAVRDPADVSNQAPAVPEHTLAEHAAQPTAAERADWMTQPRGNPLGIPGFDSKEDSEQAAAPAAAQLVLPTTCRCHQAHRACLHETDHKALPPQSSTLRLADCGSMQSLCALGGCAWLMYVPYPACEPSNHARLSHSVFCWVCTPE